MKNSDVFETERLILRRLTNEDAEQIYEMRSDADFMRHLSEPETREQILPWIEFVSQYWKYNAGFWAVVLKETNQTVGWSGTWSLLEFDIGEMEIGYAISNKHFGKGLATEAAKVALDYTFKIRRAEKVYAVATPENTTSHRIMEKLGMRFAGQRFFASYSRDMVYYGISLEDYALNAKLNSV